MPIAWSRDPAEQGFCRVNAARTTTKPYLDGAPRHRAIAVFIKNGLASRLGPAGGEWQQRTLPSLTGSRSGVSTLGQPRPLSLNVKKADLPHLNRAIISADTLGVSWFSKHIFATADDLRSGPGYRIEDAPGGKALIATGRWTPEASDLLRQGAVDALIVNYAHGFNEGTLDFLEGWPLRRLRILDRSLTDLGPLARVASSVEELYVEVHPRATLDLAPFARLRSVAGGWSLLRDTVDEVDSLRSLSTWHFSEQTLLAFSGHGDLEKLTLNQAPYLETLLGVGGLDSLSVLTVFPARELADLSDLADLAPSLRELKLEGCKAIDRIDVLAGLVNLDYLDIADCARVESVAPVARMQELTAFYAWGGTRIVDADLSPLLELPKLRDFRMRERREYRPSVGQIHANISARA